MIQTHPKICFPVLSWDKVGTAWHCPPPKGGFFTVVRFKMPTFRDFSWVMPSFKWKDFNCSAFIALRSRHGHPRAKATN